MKNMFNIYYINYEKASEISMLFDNEIVEKISKIRLTEFNANGNMDFSTDASTKIPVVGKYIPNLDVSGDLTGSRSHKVVDTVKVVSSKSTILKPIYEKAKEVRRLDDNKVGNLIKIKDVLLSVVNSNDVMGTKALMSGIINQVPVEGYGNMNLTSLMEVIFKDSAYVLCGKLPHRFGKDESLMLKIPMSAGDEMESQYSISDIEIGKVTILGIYRGFYERKDIEKKINRLMALNDKDNEDDVVEATTDCIDIEDGISDEEQSKIDKTSQNQNKVHYIDVIAIIQDLNI